jgi:beta propeller repeat protein
MPPKELESFIYSFEIGRSDSNVQWRDTMNMNKRAGVMVVMVLSIFVSPIGSISEFQITTNKSGQQHPAIYENIIVWHDYRNGNWNIFGYNLLTEEEFRITTDTNIQLHPAIYEDVVVWHDKRGPWYEWYIYGYNLSTGQESPLSAFAVGRFMESVIHPAIYADIVVWEDDGNHNWDIYGYNLSTGKKFQITANRGDQLYPAIYGDIIVWQDERDGNWNIYRYEIFSDQILQTTTNKNDQQRPAIYGDYIVWEDNRKGNWDIYGLNLLTDKVFQITTDPGDQQHPAIYENIVVWSDKRNGKWDIYGYDISSKKEFQITANPSNQKEPAIYGDIVVWMDNRNGNWDIYGCDISTIDNDGDGYLLLYDCDDNDPDIHLGATEICDGKDNNCDGTVDEGFDKDSDGYTECGGDCNDNDLDIYPGAQEICDDNKDNDCDGDTDCSDTDCTTSSHCSNKGHLKISVVDSQGYGLKAQVSVDGYKEETDSTGILLIYDLEAGKTYTVRAEVLGYNPEEETVKVEKNTTKSVSIQMGSGAVNKNYLLVGLVLLGFLLLIVFIYKFKSRSKKKITPRSSSTTSYCPHCGHKVEKTWDSCLYCGTDLKDYTKIYDENTRIY